MQKKIVKAILLFFILLVIPELILFAQEFSFYVREEIGSDNNIYETSDHAQAALTNQLWLGLKYHKKFNKNIFNLRSKTNYSIFNDHSDENKVVQILRSNYIYQISSGLLLATQFNGFAKSWNRVDRGYGDFGLSESFIWNRGRTRTCLSLAGNMTKYRQYEHFNNSNYLLALRFNFQMDQDYGLYLSLSNRAVFFPKSRYYVDSLHIYTEKERYDNSRTLKAGLEYSRGYILGVNFIYQYCNSNFNYFSNHNFTLSIYGSWKFDPILMQLIIHSRIKKYFDPPANESIVYHPDPEQNQQNKIMLGLEYPFNNDFSLTSKFAWYHNESTFISQYYDKIVMTVGVQYNF